MQNQYPHLIKSPKLKQSNAQRSNSVPNVYKYLNHRVNHFKSNLSRDIETNPGPVINSYKQFKLLSVRTMWQCLGQMLVHSVQGGMVLYPQWKVNIMNFSNELYFGLSSLSRQSQLLLTEVPKMMRVFNINYQLQYSPSYTGTIHGTCEVQDFNYCMSFANAMQALLGQNYNSFF